MNNIFNKVEFNDLGNGIIENIVKEGVSIEREDVLQIKEKNQSIAKGKKYALLISSEPFATISKAARELSASQKFAETTLAKAILVDSLGQTLVVNFYLSINKPKIKTRMFSIKDREKAIEWLKGILNEKQSFYTTNKKSDYM